MEEIKKSSLNQARIINEMKIRLLTLQLRLMEEGKRDTIEYIDTQRKLDVLEYGIDIQELINKI